MSRVVAILELVYQGIRPEHVARVIQSARQVGARISAHPHTSKPYMMTVHVHDGTPAQVHKALANSGMADETGKSFSNRNPRLSAIHKTMNVRVPGGYW